MNESNRLNVTEHGADRKTLKLLAGNNGVGMDKGLSEMNRRAKDTIEKANGKGHLGLTNPVFDEDRHLVEKDPILREGLNLSMYEYGSDSFMNLLSAAYKLDDDLPGTKTVQEAMLSANGKDSLKKLENGDAKEIILFRTNDRARLESEFPKKTLNKNFFDFLKETYGIEDGKEAERFYNENITNASRFIGWYIDKAVPQSKNALSQRNEIDPPPTDPSKILHILASENVSPELKFETQRVLNLFFLSCEFTSRQWDISLRQKLNELNELIDQRMLGGMIGEAELKTIIATHNAETGRVINVVSGDISSQIKEDVIVKHHKLKMRPLLEPLQIDDSARKNKKNSASENGKAEQEKDNVYIDFDEKSILSAMAKSIHKARRKNGSDQNGEIIPVKDAVDLCRLVIVVADSDKKKRDALAARFSDMLKAADAEDFVGKIEWVKNDDRTSGKGNSKRFGYRRLQAMFADTKIPVETQVFDMQNYLNSQLSVGQKTKDGFDGEAHELYELKKFGEIVDLLFPENLYGDLRKEIKNEQEGRAASILRRTITTRSS